MLLATVTETEPNNVLALANSYALTQDPSGSSFYTSLGVGSITPSGDVDYWSFPALKGDRVTISGDGGITGGAIYLELHNSNDTNLANLTSAVYNTGHDQISDFLIPADGTYYVRARTWDNSSILANYTARVDISRGFQGEVEPDDSQGQASPITLAPGAAGHALGTTSGNITTAGDADTFNLGYLHQGDTVDLATLRPDVSNLAPRIRLIRATGSAVVAEITGDAHLTAVLPGDDQYYAQVTASDPATAGNQALYLLNVDLAPAAPPSVVSTSLPSAIAQSPGTALQFDGQNDLVLMPNTNGIYNLTSSWTVEAWVDPFDLNLDGPTARPIVWKLANDSGSDDTFGLGWSHGQFVGQITVPDGHGGRLNYDVLSAVHSANTFLHVALGYDGESLTVYVNGILEGSTQVGPVTAFTGAAPLQVGNLLNSNHDPRGVFNGTIDEVRIWDTARSQADIRANMNQSLAGNETGLIGYWRFDEGSGTVVHDLTSNHNDGTLGSGAPSTQPSWVASTAPILNRSLTGLVSWWALDGSVIDRQGNNNPSETNSISYTAGEVGQAATFGTGGYIDVPPSSSLANQQFTWDAWVKPAGAGPNNDAYGNDILSKAVNGTNSYYITWRASDNRFLFGFGDVNSEYVTSADTFAPGQFYHVAGTYDGAIFKLYVNGVVEAQRVLSKSITYDSTTPWTIGSSAPAYRAGGFPRTWNGVIDELGIYNRALSSAEIQAIYQAGNSGRGVGGKNVPALVTQAIDRFSLTTSADLLPASATASSSYSLREAGPDGIFGNSDDTVYSLIPSYSGLGSRIVNFTIAPESAPARPLSVPDPHGPHRPRR